MLNSKMKTGIDFVKTLANKYKNLPQIKLYQPITTFNDSIIFAIILPFDIPKDFLKYVHLCFAHCDFFVEYNFLTIDGNKKAKLGELFNIIQQKKFFTSTTKFFEADENCNEYFSVKIVFAIDNIDCPPNWYLVNLTEDKWFINLKKFASDRFQVQ